MSSADTRRFSGTTTWTLVAVLAVAVNLRIAIAGISPVVDGVREAVDLSRRGAGLLTSLPVLCFGVLAPVAAYAARRLGNEVVTLLALATLTVGILVRSAGGPVWLYLGTLLLGAAIAVGNVLVPALVKQHLASVAGIAMSLYTACLTGGAALASWGTAVLYDGGWSWQWSLAAGAVPALLGLGVFGAWYRGHRANRSAAPVPPALRDARVWRSPVAWQLAAYFGAQAFLFYAFLAWLPVLLQDDGVPLATSGVMLSLYNLLGIVGALAVPPLAVRLRDQRVLAPGVAVGWLVGIGGLVLLPGGYPLWSMLLGVVQGAGLALAMTLIVLRSRDEVTARDLSGMVQMVGYLVAACAPVVLGGLRDGLGSWDAAIGVTIGMAVAMLLAGLGAGRHRMVG